VDARLSSSARQQFPDRRSIQILHLGDRRVGRNVLRSLKARAEKVIPGGKWEVHYVFFAGRGFPSAVEEEARRMNARLVDLQQMDIQQ
jgi:hypothetical protein